MIGRGAWPGWIGVLALSACIAPAAIVPAALAQGPRAAAPRAPAEREALVQNELGLSIRELYAAPVGQADPGPDRLGQDTLAPGGRLRLRLGRNQPCRFNLRAVLADESIEERRDVDLCRQNRVVFGDPSAPQREALVVNETDLPLQELYLRPANAPEGADARGPDRLGAETVAPGRSLRLRLGRTRDCVFDVTGVLADDSTVTRPRTDLCRSPRVVLGDPSLPWREARVENRAGRIIRNLHARPAEEGGGEWGADRLGPEVLSDGGSVRLRLRRAACRFDLRAVYEDDAAEERRGVDFCASLAPAVAFDGSAIPQPPTIRVTLVNRHDAPVEEVYVSAASERDWGPDRLEEPLERGERIGLSLPVECTADLRIVFPSGAAEERRELDLCEAGTIVLRPGWTLAERLDDSPAPPGPPGPRPGSVRLRNASDSPIVELYVDAPGEPRGPDRLGRNVLGSRETLDLLPPEPEACAASLVAVFRDGREVRRDPFDLCQGTEVTLP
ncbi:hypothetical protein LPC08_23800 [Roseomonas sp. OT10]|uniref:hypothetical protein n=1 Tax=Roseomonas cutis TaxID=2897332 RepID=UPI001E35725B|nr:hypothetical protein [Roseomonas sp. OT10]UFN48984.1 hypothetical protein LPC08_23800 [Roseomonas sp. OT10]